MDFEFIQIGKVMRRAAEIVTEIVSRHRTKGDALTWKLMHAITDETVARLIAEGFDEDYVNLYRVPVILPYPCTDEPPDFGKSNAIAVTFQLIRKSYEQPLFAAWKEPDKSVATEIQFTKAFYAMSRQDQERMSRAMDSYLQLPDDRRTEENLRQMLIDAGFDADRMPPNAPQ